MPKINFRSPEVILTVLVVFSTLAVWLPFLLNLDSIAGVQLKETGRQVLDRYLDGPLFVVVSKTFYSSESDLYSYFDLPPEYFTSHFPLYPLLIRLFSFAGFFNSMLLVTLLSSIGAVLAFYFLLKDFNLSKKPFLLAVFFVFFPFRWLLYHSVGANEALFVFLSLSSFHSFRKQAFARAGIFGALATLTRPVGILLFPAFLVHLYFKNRSFLKSKAWTPFLLIPLSLCLLVLFFATKFSVFAPFVSVNAFYFQGFLSGVTAYNGAVGGEFVAVLLLLYSLGTLRLLEQKHYDFFAYSVLYLLPLLFLSHNDFSRYLLPIAPFALFIGFNEIWVSKYAKYVLPLIVLAGLFYAWTTLPTNLVSESTYRSIFS
ncbi:MAG: hypothetical protein A3C84_00890 [Candidatus Ryanbacteria bacterium RIFCSPHIGHO2_02_FULL_48_12]|nr:MAG: hypothetical protein A3C84_00890 [Candidatus Ryanbacteria bacterium RIFCSPHIGHO2_02_FULL_48_12]